MTSNSSSARPALLRLEVADEVPLTPGRTAALPAASWTRFSPRRRQPGRDAPSAAARAARSWRRPPARPPAGHGRRARTRAAMRARTRGAGRRVGGAERVRRGAGGGPAWSRRAAWLSGCGAGRPGCPGPRPPAVGRRRRLGRSGALGALGGSRSRPLGRLHRPVVPAAVRGRSAASCAAMKSRFSRPARRPEATSCGLSAARCRAARLASKPVAMTVIVDVVAHALVDDRAEDDVGLRVGRLA